MPGFRSQGKFSNSLQALLIDTTRLKQLYNYDAICLPPRQHLSPACAVAMSPRGAFNATISTGPCAPYCGYCHSGASQGLYLRQTTCTSMKHLQDHKPLKLQSRPTSCTRPIEHLLCDVELEGGVVCVWTGIIAVACAVALPAGRRSIDGEVQPVASNRCCHLQSLMIVN